MVTTTEKVKVRKHVIKDKSATKTKMLDGVPIVNLTLNLYIPVLVPETIIDFIIYSYTNKQSKTKHKKKLMALHAMNFLITVFHRLA